MRNRFERQLAELNSELIAMGALCEEAISSAVKYLMSLNEAFRKTVTDAEIQINQKEREIEGLCIKLLLQQQPVATDLRMISSALKMISDMERIGDQASDIAEMARYTENCAADKAKHIEEMSQAVIQMVNQSIDSFVYRDLKIAKSVLLQDDIIDKLFLEVKKELIEGMQSESCNTEVFIDLLMIAKYFERIGDHAENIAEWVIYSISGSH